MSTPSQTAKPDLSSLRIDRTQRDAGKGGISAHGFQNLDSVVLGKVFAPILDKSEGFPSVVDSTIMQPPLFPEMRCRAT